MNDKFALTGIEDIRAGSWSGRREGHGPGTAECDSPTLRTTQDQYQREVAYCAWESFRRLDRRKAMHLGVRKTQMTCSNALVSSRLWTWQNLRKLEAK